jgi:hypothetical protein
MIYLISKKMWEKNNQNQNINILKNDLLKYTFVELIPNNNCYRLKICNNDSLSTYKVIKSFQTLLLFT